MTAERTNPTSFRPGRRRGPGTRIRLLLEAGKVSDCDRDDTIVYPPDRRVVAAVPRRIDGVARGNADPFHREPISCLGRWIRARQVVDPVLGDVNPHLEMFDTVQDIDRIGSIVDAVCERTLIEFTIELRKIVRPDAIDGSPPHLIF